MTFLIGKVSIAISKFYKLVVEEVNKTAEAK